MCVHLRLWALMQKFTVETKVIKLSEATIWCQTGGSLPAFFHHIPHWLLHCSCCQIQIYISDFLKGKSQSHTDTGSPPGANVTVYSPSVVTSTHRSTEDKSGLQTHSSRFTLLPHCTACQRLGSSTFPRVSEWMEDNCQAALKYLLEFAFILKEKASAWRCTWGSSLQSSSRTATMCWDTDHDTGLLLVIKSACVLWFSSHQTGLLLSMLTWHQ